MKQYWNAIKQLKIPVAETIQLPKQIQQIQQEQYEHKQLKVVRRFRRHKLQQQAQQQRVFDVYVHILSKCGLKDICTFFVSIGRASNFETRTLTKKTLNIRFYT